MSSHIVACIVVVAITRATAHHARLFKDLRTTDDTKIQLFFGIHWNDDYIYKTPPTQSIARSVHSSLSVDRSRD